MVSRHLEQHNDQGLHKRRLSSDHSESNHLEQAVKSCQLHHFPSPPSEVPLQNLKRSSEDSPLVCKESLWKKKHRLEPVSSSHESEVGYGPEIDWEDYFGDWPPTVADKMQNAPSRPDSYSKRVRDGVAPVAWTRKHQEKMLEAGMFMTADRSQAAITDRCQELCDKLLKADYAMPEGRVYQQDRIVKVLNRVQLRNESRVVRDATPLLVPSPELLHIDGHAQLENVCEAMSAEWTDCDTLYGPMPKPDFVVGLAAAAFTKAEKEKLQMCHTSASPNLFPENMYFPLLICEVKCSDRAIEEAERQAMHSASIATRAVIELFRKISATDEVDQKVLTFSVAHNHSTVKIFAHFARIDGQQTSFYRRLLHFQLFTEDLESAAWTKTYKIIRAVYEHFVPQHLERIQTALSKMQTPPPASLATQLDIDMDSQVSTTDRSLSQDSRRSKKSRLPTVTQLQAENDKLRNKLLEMFEEQKAEASRQREEQHKQNEQMEKQLGQQKEQMERQLAQQKEHMEKQLAHQEVIINLLKTSQATARIV